LILFLIGIFLFLLARINRRQLTDGMVDGMLYNTPPKHRGSKKFFRNLENDGKISNIFSFHIYSFQRFNFLYGIFISLGDFNK
jgi:hypothetical protein